MKTIEEKAKAYDESLKKAKALYGSSEPMSGCSVILETILPELAESEDEKVRKELTKHLKELSDWKEDEVIPVKNPSYYRQWASWLERQGEKKSVEENKGNIGGNSSNWSEEDEENMKKILDAIGSYYYLTTDDDVLCTWLKSLKGRVSCEANCTTTKEWSEEDSFRTETLISVIKSGGSIRPELRNEFVNWLKSLRPQNTYNPYKAVVESIAEMCKHYDGVSHIGLRDFYDNVKVKCKDAKEYDKMFPQAQWKPSDEQIKVCKEVYADILSAKGFDLGTVNSELNRMEEQLKKLKKK